VKRSAGAGIAAALVLALGAYAVFQGRAARLSYDFSDSEVVGRWQVLGEVLARRVTPAGLVLEAGGPIMLASPDPQVDREGLGSLHWRQARFVRVELSPAPEDRSIALVWSPGRDPRRSSRLAVTVPAGASRVVVDTRERRPWLVRGGWVDRFPPEGRVGLLGLALEGNATVRRITLLPLLPPGELLAVALAGYWTAEPVIASSINFQHGASILGVPLSPVLGALAALLGLVALVRARPRDARRFACGALVLFGLFDLTVTHALWAHARAQRSRSAWHADRYDEYRARFGEEFAKLDAIVRAQVPRRARVALPDPIPAPGPRQTNWLWFLYCGEYENVLDRERDNSGFDPHTEYVVFYRPRHWIHEHELGLLRHRATGAAIPVTVVAAVSPEAMLLRVGHD
jgi:hypothetical protein